MLRPVSDSSRPIDAMIPAVRSALDRVLEGGAVDREMADPAVASDFKRVRDLGMRKGAIEPAASAYRELLDAEREAADLRAAIAQAGESTEAREFAALAREELPGVESRIGRSAARALEALVSGDDARIASVILELRAGVGGDEAALWAGDLLPCTSSTQPGGWRVETLDLAEGRPAASSRRCCRSEARACGSARPRSRDTLREARARDRDAGRIHTSTATVAVLPEPEEVELAINPADVVEHVTTAQGGRPERQQGRDRGAPDPHAHRSRGALQESKPAPEPREGVASAQGAPVRDRTRTGPR